MMAGAMRRLLLLVLSAASLFAADFHPDKPISEIPLTDGRVLKNVQVISFAPTAVMAKWDGGRGTIRYEVLPAELARDMQKYRPKGKEPAAVIENKATPARTVTGQVFTITAGAGAYKFAGVNIYAYPMSEWKKAAERQRNLYSSRSHNTTQVGRELEQSISWLEATTKLKSVASASTDADGRYSLKLPEGEFFIVCTAERKVSGSVEVNVWAMPVTRNDLDLNTNNEWRQPR